MSTALHSSQQVMLRDGTMVTLHPVLRRGAPCLYLRGVKLHGKPLVIDLRHLVHDLAEDLKSVQTRDVPGVVLYTLREHFATAASLLKQVARHGTHMDDKRGTRRTAVIPRPVQAEPNPTGGAR